MMKKAQVDFIVLVLKRCGNLKPVKPAIGPFPPQELLWCVWFRYGVEQYSLDQLFNTFAAR